MHSCGSICSRLAITSATNYWFTNYWFSEFFHSISFARRSESSSLGFIFNWERITHSNDRTVNELAARGCKLGQGESINALNSYNLGLTIKNIALYKQNETGIGFDWCRCETYRERYLHQFRSLIGQYLGWILADISRSNYITIFS